jgi:hypothetical protein
MTETTDASTHTREELRRVATHVLARAQHDRVGRIGLRATPGGFGTVQFGERRERLRVSDGFLVREAGGPPSVSGAVPLAGSTLAELAAFAEVQLVDGFSVGHDTPPLGDVDAPLRLDADDGAALAGWFDLTARALDRVVASLPPTVPEAAPTLAQLWPEHFDLALDVAFDVGAPAERRVNLGGSPGDELHPAPYLYVGPWTADRPGHPAFWTAPFGAVLGFDEVTADPDPVGRAVRFLLDGFGRLAAGP